jgi:hypothetical protein
MPVSQYSGIPYSSFTFFLDYYFGFYLLFYRYTGIKRDKTIINNKLAEIFTGILLVFYRNNVHNEPSNYF